MKKMVQDKSSGLQKSFGIKTFQKRAFGWVALMIFVAICGLAPLSQTSHQ